MVDKTKIPDGKIEFESLIIKVKVGLQGNNSKGKY